MWTIRINSNYGFDHNWTLVQQKRSEDGTYHMTSNQFYLGQDVKFCERVLGMTCGDVARRIKSNDLRDEKTRRKLARFIMRHLDLNTKRLRTMESWELCAE